MDVPCAARVHLTVISYQACVGCGERYLKCRKSKRLYSFAVRTASHGRPTLQQLTLSSPQTSCNHPVGAFVPEKTCLSEPTLGRRYKIWEASRAAEDSVVFRARRCIRTTSASKALQPCLSRRRYVGSHAPHRRKLMVDPANRYTLGYVVSLPRSGR